VAEQLDAVLRPDGDVIQLREALARKPHRVAGGGALGGPLDGAVRVPEAAESRSIYLIAQKMTPGPNPRL
jgi:hypothetical protein